MKESLKKQIQDNLNHRELGKKIDLSSEELTITDYEWLATILKQASYIEEIILPHRIPETEIEKVIAIVHRITSHNSSLTTIVMHSCNYSLPPLSDLQLKQINLHLMRNKQRIFAIHGGGNIGLGLMADVLKGSHFQYHAIATSNNMFISNLINSSNKLWLQHSDDGKDVTCINHVTMIPRLSADIIDLYKKANLAAICVTPEVIHSVASDIAKGLFERYKLDGAGLKILILMNLPKCAEFVKNKVKIELMALTYDAILCEKILEGIEFIPTVIDRIVTNIPQHKVQEQIRRQLIQLGYEHQEKQIDKILHSSEQLRVAIQKHNLQFNLFNAEKKFSIYIPIFPEAKLFPEIKTASDLEQYEAIKNKYINGPHAILAWMGGMMGCTTIAEAIKNPTLYAYIKELLEKEIGPILKTVYPTIAENELQFMEKTFFERCANSTSDPVVRVGRDPLRKLESGGRIRGTLELAHKHHLPVSTSRLEEGIAAGILYAIKDIDPSNPSCQKIKEIYYKNNHSIKAVLCYSGPTPNGNYRGLHPSQDKLLVNNILEKIPFITKMMSVYHNQSNYSSTAKILVTKTRIVETSTMTAEYNSSLKSVSSYDISLQSSIHSNNFWRFSDSTNSVPAKPIGNEAKQKQSNTRGLQC